MDLLDLAEQFAWMIENASTIEELGQRLTEITWQMGCQYFALVQHLDVSRTPHKMLRLNNYPDILVRQIEEQRLMMSDPVHRLSQMRNHGFPWSDLKRLLRLTSSDTNWLRHAYTLGIGDGYTVPTNVAGETSGSCSFAMASDREFPRHWLPLIHGIGSHAFQRARQILRLREFDVLAPRLTDRQLQCVLLMAQGYTTPQIAAMLGLGTETVNSHLKQAREQYGVGNKTLLLAHVLKNSTIVFDDIIL